MTDRETALAQLETIEDAYTRWMLARAVGCPDMEHRDAQALSSALFAMFDGGPEADDEPCAIKRALRLEAQGVKVRELEWESVQSGIWKSGHYSIWHQWASDGKFHASVSVGSPAAHIIGRGYTSLEDAKAAAQADYEDRILSALDRPEAQDGVAEAAGQLVADGRRWHLGTNSGNVFDPDEDFDGITLTVEVRGEEEARDIGFALCLIGSE